MSCIALSHCRSRLRGVGTDNIRWAQLLIGQTAEGEPNTESQVTTGEASATQPGTCFPAFPSDSLRESEGKAGSVGHAVSW